MCSAFHSHSDNTAPIGALPKDTLASRLEELGIEPPTLRLVDDPVYMTRVPLVSLNTTDTSKINKKREVRADKGNGDIQVSQQYAN